MSYDTLAAKLAVVETKLRPVILVGITISIGSPAHAYIDPGSGSVLISVLIGGFLSCGIIIKTYWFKVKKLFMKRKRNADHHDVD